MEWGLWSVKCRVCVECVGCKVWSGGRGLWSVKCRVCGVSSVKWGVWSVKCGVGSGDSGVWTGKWRVRSV